MTLPDDPFTKFEWLVIKVAGTIFFVSFVVIEVSHAIRWLLH